MVYVLVRHTVKDFKTWKKVFDERLPLARKHGGKGGFIFKNHDNLN